VTDWSVQATWESVEVGDELPTISFPLSAHRMIVQAAANRDFSSIHHNSEWAQQTGAPEMYVNNVFLQGMWERVIREYIGMRGAIRQIGPMRMRTFCTVGETVVVTGTVARKWSDGSAHLVELSMASSTSAGVAVSGSAIASLPTSGIGAPT
jgi:acyl dehydratase